MDKEQQTKALNFIKKQIAHRRGAIDTLAKYLTTLLKEDLQGQLESQQTIENGYIRYIELLGKYQGSNSVAPLDVFPGIHATSALYNSEDMQKDTQEMTALANQIKHALTTIKKDEDFLISDIKEVTRIVSPYLKASADIRDALAELIEELDSVYDVGMLAKNS
jgi:hypothetical protein